MGEEWAWCTKWKTSNWVAVVEEYLPGLMQTATEDVKGNAISQEFTLPQTESFYTTPLHFEIRLDTTACGRFKYDRRRFKLVQSSLLAPLLAQIHKMHMGNLETISVAALRFLRSGEVRLPEPAEYAAQLFMTRHSWGLAFQRSPTGSISHNSNSSRIFHSEALRVHTELFAYGLAVHFVAQFLGIPIDRFFFVTKSGARADFHARISLQELFSTGAGVGALSPSGHVVGLEVKARTGWASYRTQSAEGRKLLFNLSKKVTAAPNQAFLSVLVAFPGDEQSDVVPTRIIIADPGETNPLSKDEQLTLLLEESIPLLIRHGLWPTLQSAVDWLNEVRVPLLKLDVSLVSVLTTHSGRRQYQVAERSYGNRSYNGRVFSDVLLRLGRPGSRTMSREEAKDRLDKNDFGRVWFSGADWAWIGILQSHDADSLLRYGVRKAGSQDLSGQSAFIMEEEPLDDDMRTYIRAELARALRRW